MAFAAAPAASGRRPTVVTVACWLLYAVAAAQIAYAIVILSQLGATKAALTRVFAGTQMEGAQDAFAAMMTAPPVARGVLSAIGCLVLAVFVGRGKHAARIVTWVVAGLLICCSGSDVASSAMFARNLGGGANGPSNQEIQRALDSLPDWYQPLLTTINALSVTAIVTVVILLALPISSGFFRPAPQPAMEPPVPPATV
jgi:hypothetical protein